LPSHVSRSIRKQHLRVHQEVTLHSCGHGDFQGTDTQHVINDRCPWRNSDPIVGWMALELDGPSRIFNGKTVR
ncbi:MAG: hypothetical protein LUP99_01730, partial [Methanomicrobiales archaeon]|nr:hypothetical protein [Methanomicrobiales archaeon]